MSSTATATGLVKPRYRPPAPAELPTYEGKLERDVADLEDENQRLRLRLGTMQTERDRALTQSAAKNQTLARLRNTIAALRDALAAAKARRPSRGRSQHYKLGRLSLNLTMREMRFDGHTIPLSPGEAEVMALLFARPDVLIETPELTTGMAGSPSKNSVRSYICRVRVKLERVGARGYLNGRNGWGAGGYWVTDPERAQS